VSAGNKSFKANIPARPATVHYSSRVYSKETENRHSLALWKRELPVQNRSKQATTSARGKKRKALPAERKTLPQKKRERNSNPVPRPGSIQDTYKYNPISVEHQHQICANLGLRFVAGNRTVPGGPDVQLRTPTRTRRIPGDGNCLFRALSYLVTGSESQHSEIRHLIVQHLLTEENCIQLLANYISVDNTIGQYLERTHMERDGVWGTTVELVTFSHMAGVNVASYNTEDERHHVLSPGVIDSERFPEDNSRPTIYIQFTGGNHFNVTLSQD
jgi:hypothetical protein